MVIGPDDEECASGSHLLVEPAALNHWGIKIPLDGVGPLAKVVDLFGRRAGRLSGRKKARRNHSDELKAFECSKRIISS